MRMWIVTVAFWGALLGPLAAPARAASGAGASSPAVTRYLNAVYVRLHAVWVKVVLARIADTMLATDPFNDPRRHVTLRITFSGKGDLEGATVLRGSGYQPFDNTALHAVLLSHSFPRPPRDALSDNGQVFLDWTFRRSKPWCHPTEANLHRRLFPAQRAVRTFLRQGRFDKALARLQLAYRQGRLAEAAHAFGLEILRLAASQGKTVDARNFVRALADPAMPLEVFRALLGGLVGVDTHAAVVQQLVARASPVADAMLAEQLRLHLADRPTQALVFLRGMLARPSSGRYARAALRGALAHRDPELSASAAALLLAGREPGQRNAALQCLSGHLSSVEPARRLAALRVMGAVVKEAGLLPPVDALAHAKDTPTNLRRAALHALAAYGTPTTLKTLLLLTYNRTLPDVQALALEALVTRPTLPKSACYRLLGLLAKPPAPAMLELAGRGLARGCLARLPYEVSGAARHRRWQVRLGVASALPAGGALTDRILIRLAADPVARVRLAALTTMAAQRRPAFQAPLARAATRGPAAAQRLGLLFTRDPKRLGRALRREQGEPWLRLARHAIVVAPKVAFPLLLKRLRPDDWDQRLQAAWVLMAYRPMGLAPVTPAHR